MAKRDKHTKEQKRKRVKPYERALHKQAKCYRQTILSKVHKGPSLTNWLCTKRTSVISTQKSRKERGQALRTGFAQTGQVLQANNTINSSQRAKPYQLALHKTAKRDKHTKEQKRKRVKPYERALHKQAKCYRQTILSIVHKGPNLTNWLCTKRPSVISTQKSRKGKGSSLTNGLCTNRPSVTGKQHYQ